MKISVIMPVYNGEKYLREAVDSILNQTISDFEFIIINDCSTDSTEDIIKSYNDSRIVYIKNEKNLGVAGTLNKGLEIAKGEYIARMDADDISLPTRFEKQVAFMDENPDVALCGAKVLRLYENGEEEGYTVFGPENIKISMLFAPCIAHPVVMIRSSIIKINNFRYDEHFEKIEDYELWTRINETYDIDNVPEVLFKYRIHSTQVSNIFSNVQFYKLVELKRRLLNNMNIECSESQILDFVNIGCGKSVSEYNTAKQILEKIYITNKSTKFYNHKILRTYLKNVLFNLYSSNKNSTTQNINLKCEFISKKDIFYFSLKKHIKRYLKRKR